MKVLDGVALTDVAHLAQEVLRQSGGIPLLKDPAFLEHHFGTSVAVIGPDGLDVLVGLTPEGGVRRASLIAAANRTGDVERLLRWCERWAAGLNADLGVVEAWSLTPALDSVLHQIGFDRSLVELVMTAPTQGSVDWQPDRTIALASWDDASPASFFEVYEASFRERPGFPGWSLDEWVDWTSEDESFDPVATVLAHVDGVPAGFLTVQEDCLLQIGVRPEYRGSGVLPALLLHARTVCSERGYAATWLTVSSSNHRAVRAYRRQGFELSGRRGRFTRWSIPQF